MATDGYNEGRGFGPFGRVPSEAEPVSPDEAGSPYELRRDAAAQSDPGAAASFEPVYQSEAGALFQAQAEPAYVSEMEPVYQLGVGDLGPEPAVRAHPLLGELLMQQAGVTAEQIATALETQEVEGGRLGEILIRARACSEEQVQQALAEQLGLEFVETLLPDEVDVELLRDLPIGYVKAQRCLPLRRTERGVVMAVADPLNATAQDDVRTLLEVEIELVVVSPARIIEVINTVYTRRGDAVELGDGEEFSDGDAEELIDIIDLDDEAPIIRWVNSLLFNAAKERASDIHIEPGEKDVVVRNRIDGVLYETKHAHKQYLPSIVARVKIMAGLNIAEKRLPQDGRIRRKIAGRDIDMRVATIPTARGERVTIRLLDRTAVLLDMADIGMGPDHLEQMAELIVRPHGILMVTGPTGSGKTTTLYSALSKINSPDKNILTVEDPVEYQLEGISQVQVNPKIELTFAAGLRSFLRHDPDVIMVGEIRDLETAEIAIQASLTGHLVFSTVHTNDSAGAITRLVDMGVEPFLVASSLSGLLAQRLVRRLCLECREVYEPTYEEIRNLGLEPEAFYAGAIPPHPTKDRDGPAPPAGRAFRSKGCPSCLGTGYTGRLGIYELLMLDDQIRAMALKNTDAVTIKRAAINQGMRTLRDDGARKVVAGITSIAEVMRVTQEDVA
ncbi:MAG: type II secretion system ATPase GspE [bacterium]